MGASEESIRESVRERYAKAATMGTFRGPDCCGPEYSAAELVRIPVESVLGLGSGNPVRHADLREGEVAVDLGSGAGVDVFIAADRVGPSGRVFGIDMTSEMLERARALAAREGIANAEFLEAFIEKLPFPDRFADIVLSNCVINLSTDKAAVFHEAFRVLKPGGRLVVSDVVQERPLGVIEDDCGCVATAMVRGEYLDTIVAAGFRSIEVLEDRPWRAGSHGIDASAITLRAIKPIEEVKA